MKIIVAQFFTNNLSYGKYTKEINKKYDDQAEALRKVKEVNDQIIQQQKDQLDLADAITSGDISAAARAAQQSRANMASTYADQQMSALDQARQNELGALTGAETGLTQDQIQERQYQIQQELYRIETSPERMAIKNEQTRLEDEIYKLEQLRQIKLEEIRAKEDEILKIQINELEPAQQKIQDLQDANELIQEQIDKLVVGLKKFPDVAILSDEIYSRQIYDNKKMPSFFNYPELFDRQEFAGDECIESTRDMCGYW